MSPRAEAAIPGNDAARGRPLYLLACIPLLTEFIQTGSWPDSPRAWITEVVLAIVIIALARRVSRDMRDMAHMARVDVLTGLWNRRAFAQVMGDEYVRARRTSQRLTLIYLDLDHFKEVNDEYGHAAGDQVLRQVARVLQDAVRAHVDRCFRLGGDEFALLLPGSSASDAESVIRRIHHRSHSLPKGLGAAGVRISCGLVELRADEDVDAFLRRADREMYRHKLARPVAEQRRSGRGVRLST